MEPITHKTIELVEVIKPLLNEYYTLVNDKQKLISSLSAPRPDCEKVATISFFTTYGNEYRIPFKEEFDGLSPYEELTEFMLDYFDIKIELKKQELINAGYSFE